MLHLNSDQILYIFQVALCIQECETSDGGEYICELRNKLGADSCDAKLTIRKIYCPPQFIQKFGDLQQLPTFDAKFPAKISGVPQPVVSWTKDGNAIHESLKFHVKRDGDSHCLYIKDCTPEDGGLYKCQAHNKEGSASCEAKLQVVTKM